VQLSSYERPVAKRNLFLAAEAGIFAEADNASLIVPIDRQTRRRGHIGAVARRDRLANAI
jgi:hypothetical protein